MIILEGNECCFKTTIAEKLSKKLNIPVIKGSSFEHSQCTNEELFNKFKEYAELENVIIDRFIYSNYVYATLYEDFAILTDEQRTQIEEIIKQKAKVYYLFADDHIIQQRIEQRGDDYVNVDMVSKINQTYTQSFFNTILHINAFDTEEWNSDEIVEEIIKDITLK
jgi:thymidylate kinase